jgi:hypothetical protein
MNANFDADLELLETGHCTVQPRDEIEDLVFREQDLDDLLDDPSEF